MNYLDELKSLGQQRNDSFKNTFLWGAGEEAQQWRKGKEGEEGREAGKNRGGRSVTSRLPRANEWGLLPRRKKPSALYTSEHFKKNEVNASRRDKPCYPKYHRREGWKLRGVSFSDMLTVLTEEKQEGGEEYKD